MNKLEKQNLDRTQAPPPARGSIRDLLRRPQATSSTRMLSSTLFARYLIILILFAVGVVGFYFLSYIFFSSIRIWHAYEPAYRFLQIFANHPIETIILTWIVGGIAVSAWMMRRPLTYIDAIVEASDRLLDQDDAPIHLPPALKGVEDQMNLAKQRSLRNASAAREAEQRKNDLIVYLAHDLKTPLTSVIGYLTLLRDEPELSPKMRAKYTNIALDKAERLEELINEFFDITRFNLSQLTLAVEETDLTRMLQQVASEFEPVFGEKGLRCTLDLPEKLPYVCDTDKMARVFDNLLRNAVNYSFPDSEVAISGRTAGAHVILQFRNVGKTIPQEKLSRIFEQFFRLDSSRASSSGGAGLGLAIAKEIVELHGGGITAASADNLVTFTVALPLEKEGEETA